MPARRQWTWHPPFGPPLSLSDLAGGVYVRWEMSGFMAPTYRIATRRTPGRAGTVLESVVADERRIELGLTVWSTDRGTFLDRARSVAHALSPASGLPGRLEVIESDGTMRWIECLCVEGLEGAEARGQGAQWTPTLSFLATEPFVKTQPITETWALSGTLTGWFPEIPIRLTSGVGGRRQVINPGDVEAFPVIKVRGPGDDLVVTNRTTGKGLHLEYTIPDTGLASEIVIDTRPGEQSIRDGFGVNLYPYLTDEDPSLWSLAPGVNDLDVRLSGTSTGSTVEVRFTPLFESL